MTMERELDSPKALQLHMYPALPLLLTLCAAANADEVRVMTDRLHYQDAQTVWVRTWHLQEPDGSTLNEGRVRYRLLDPSERIVEDLRVQVVDGLAQNGLPLYWWAERGTWTVEVEDEDGAVVRQAIQVEIWEQPPATELHGGLGLQVLVERKGDRLNLLVESRDSEGRLVPADLALSVGEVPRHTPPKPWPFLFHCYAKDRSWIDRAIQDRLHTVRHCYETALRTDPGLSGEVVVGLTLDSSATLEEVRIHESSLAHEWVERCILDTLATVDFGPHDLHGVAYVTYPFRLRPEEGTELHPGPGYAGELWVAGRPFSRVRSFWTPGPEDVVADDRMGTALWIPCLHTDSRGQARVELVLPDEEADWEVRIAGAGGDHFGSVTAEVPP